MVTCENWVEHVATSKKMATWTRQETLKLLEVWGRETFKHNWKAAKEIKGCSRQLLENYRAKVTTEVINSVGKS